MDISKEIEIFENLKKCDEVQNDAEKLEDIEKKIKSLRGQLIAAAKNLDTDEFSRKDQSDISFIRTQLGEIGIFEGGSFETTNFFIARCQKVYDLTVKSNKKLEKQFITDVKARCSVHVTHRMNESHDTWEELKKEIFANFSGGITAIQSLQRALNTPYDKRRGFKRLATQISLNLQAAKATIEKAVKKKVMKQEPGGEAAVGITSSTEPLTVDKLMEHLGASIMATIIQVNHNELYNSMAPAWKKIESAGELAEQAEYYQNQRSSGEVSTYYGRQSYGNSNRKQNGNVKKQGDYNEANENGNRKGGNSGGGGSNSRGNRKNWNNKKQFKKRAYVENEEKDEKETANERENSSDDEQKETLFVSGRSDFSLRAGATCFALDPYISKSTLSSYGCNSIQPCVDIKLKSSNFRSAYINALIDTGSSITMISRKNIPKELLGQVRQYDGKVNGIGSGRLTGLLSTEMKLGNIWLANVRVFIVESDIPMLIGRDVIFERSDYKCLPDTDGLRMINKALKKEEQHIQYVRAVAYDQGSDWEDVIAPVVFAINTVKNRATKCTPFEAVFGRVAAPLNITVPSSKPDQHNPETYAHQCAETLRRSANIIKIAQTEADERQKRANPSTRLPEEIHEGEFVFLKRPVSAQAKREHTQMIGPYRVTASDGHVLCIDDNQQNKWVHRQHIVLAKRRRPDLSEEIDMFGSSDEEVAPISEIKKSDEIQLRRSTRTRRKPDRFQP